MAFEHSPRKLAIIDCSGNPNYPEATARDWYVVSVSGKIGGASGTPVGAGAILRCVTDTVGGTQATVGSAWSVDQAPGANGGDITFLKENSHTISVDNSTTASLEGGQLTIRSGAGTDAEAGGAMTIVSGRGGATGEGGATTITSGAGGATSGASGGVVISSGTTTASSTSASGPITVQSGLGCNGATSTDGGASGAVTVKSQAGGTTATGTGGSSGAVAISSGNGGAATGNGTGGNAAAATLTAGNGGAAAGTGAAVGGVGGNSIVTGGAGGAAAGTSAAGAGGSAQLASGAGGAKTGTGTADGGAAGTATILGGVGGATAATSGGVGGVGGDIAITGGAGGAASAGTSNGGAGGSIVLTPGAGGASAGGTAGVAGVIIERGVKLVKQGAQTAKTQGATLTAAEILTGIITTDAADDAADNYQLCEAADLDTALPDAAAGDAFDFSVINIGTHANEDVTVTTHTGWTLVGSMIVPSNESGASNAQGRFRARKTGAGAWTLYRIG